MQPPQFCRRLRFNQVSSTHDRDQHIPVDVGGSSLEIETDTLKKSGRIAGSVIDQSLLHSLKGPVGNAFAQKITCKRDDASVLWDRQEGESEAPKGNHTVDSAEKHT